MLFLCLFYFITTADKFLDIWGTFGQTIGNQFGKVSPLSIFSIIQSLLLQKKLRFYVHIPNIYFGFGLQQIKKGFSLFLSIVHVFQHYFYHSKIASVKLLPLLFSEI